MVSPVPQGELVGQVSHLSHNWRSNGPAWGRQPKIVTHFHVRKILRRLRAMCYEMDFFRAFTRLIASGRGLVQAMGLPCRARTPSHNMGDGSGGSRDVVPFRRDKARAGPWYIGQREHGPWGCWITSTIHNEYTTHSTTSLTKLHSRLLSRCRHTPPEATFARIRAFSSMTAAKLPLIHPPSGRRPSDHHPNRPRPRGPNETPLLQNDPKSK